MVPVLNEKRARMVLSRIDEILCWEDAADRVRERRFVELGRYLCEVRAQQYWRLEKLHSFDDFLSKRFPESRRKAYYLMSIHERLPQPAREKLEEVGWSKAVELVKIARRERQRFDCATWLHRARVMPKHRFQEAVKQFLAGDCEPSDMMYFKLFKSQVPVVERALDVAARMLGSDRARGYCLEMICADFLAGASVELGDGEGLYASVWRLVCLLPAPMQHRLVETIAAASAPQSGSLQLEAPAVLLEGTTSEVGSGDDQMRDLE